MMAVSTTVREVLRSASKYSVESGSVRNLSSGSDSVLVRFVDGGATHSGVRWRMQDRDSNRCTAVLSR